MQKTRKRPSVEAATVDLLRWATAATAPSGDSCVPISLSPGRDCVVAALPAMTGISLQVRHPLDLGDIGAVPGRAPHDLVHDEPLRQAADIEDQVGAILGLYHARLILSADRVRPLVEDRGRDLARQEDAGADAALAFLHADRVAHPDEAVLAGGDA